MRQPSAGPSIPAAASSSRPARKVVTFAGSRKGKERDDSGNGAGRDNGMSDEQEMMLLQRQSAAIKRRRTASDIKKQQQQITKKRNRSSSASSSASPPGRNEPLSPSSPALRDRASSSRQVKAHARFASSRDEKLNEVPLSSFINPGLVPREVLEMSGAEALKLEMADYRSAMYDVVRGEMDLGTILLEWERVRLEREKEERAEWMEQQRRTRAGESDNIEDEGEDGGEDDEDADETDPNAKASNIKRNERKHKTPTSSLKRRLGTERAMSTSDVGAASGSSDLVARSPTTLSVLSSYEMRRRSRWPLHSSLLKLSSTSIDDLSLSDELFAIMRRSIRESEEIEMDSDDGAAAERESGIERRRSTGPRSAYEHNAPLCAIPDEKEMDRIINGSNLPSAPSLVTSDPAFLPESPRSIDEDDLNSSDSDDDELQSTFYPSVSQIIATVNTLLLRLSKLVPLVNLPPADVGESSLRRDVNWRYKTSNKLKRIEEAEKQAEGREGEGEGRTVDWKDVLHVARTMSSIPSEVVDLLQQQLMALYDTPTSPPNRHIGTIAGLTTTRSERQEEDVDDEEWPTCSTEINFELPRPS